ncbi:MAG TPA: glycosyltransferase [bacterium]|jgi:glycosyltransferase involved in cell wall biosynthesis
MAEPELTLSVVVISFNQKDFLQRLVGQLLEQDYDPARYEIIVVDDGSTDGSREWLKSVGDARMKPVFGETNLGRSASRNSGIRAAGGRIIVMIDGDHTIQPDFLSIHAARHRRERCVIVGKSDFVEHPDFRALNSYLNGSGAKKLPLDARLPGRYFLTRNCSVPRDLLIEVGLFDETFTAWGGEDLDLGVRLEMSGVPIYGEPRALAIHHHLRPLNDLLRNMRVYGRGGIPILLARHPQLFTELNLHRVLPAPNGPQSSVGSRWGMRLLLTPVPYVTVRWLANRLRRRRLPRSLLDYLHFRQYVCGYMDYLKSHERNM